MALQILGSIRHGLGDGGGFEVLEARIKALKGLIELICGDTESGAYGRFFRSFVLYVCLLFTVTEFQSLSAAQTVFEGIPREGLLSGKVYTL